MALFTSRATDMEENHKNRHKREFTSPIFYDHARTITYPDHDLQIPTGFQVGLYELVTATCGKLYDIHYAPVIQLGVRLNKTISIT